LQRLRKASVQQPQPQRQEFQSQHQQFLQLQLDQQQTNAARLQLQQQSRQDVTILQLNSQQQQQQEQQAATGPAQQVVQIQVQQPITPGTIRPIQSISIPQIFPLLNIPGRQGPIQVRILRPLQWVIHTPPQQETQTSSVQFQAQQQQWPRIITPSNVGTPPYRIHLHAPRKRKHPQNLSRVQEPLTLEKHQAQHPQTVVIPVENQFEVPETPVQHNVSNQPQTLVQNPFTLVQHQAQDPQTVVTPVENQFEVPETPVQHNVSNQPQTLSEQIAPGLYQLAQIAVERLALERPQETPMLNEPTQQSQSSVQQQKPIKQLSLREKFLQLQQKLATKTEMYY